MTVPLIVMAAALSGALALATAIDARPSDPPLPAPPQAVFQELFIAVQSARIFPDGKTFADAVPKEPPERILAAYRRELPRSDDALRSFVDAHFIPPQEATSAAAEPDRESLLAHIDQLWNQLTRTTKTAPPDSSLLTLPYPYVVPGGRFREMYYWDSYFTMLGLMQSGRRDLAEDMVRDFAYLIDTYGHVPNGARTYYLSRSQPPFFFEMVGLLSADDPAASFGRYLPQLRREYAFWMRGASELHRGSAQFRVVMLDDGSTLNRFWDDEDTPRDESYAEDTELAKVSTREPRQLYRDIRAAAESGWDFSSRWFADSRTRASLDTTEIIPVDLNSLLFGLEQAISAGCMRTGDSGCRREFEQRAARRRKAIDRHLWNAPSGAYLDYRWTRRERIAGISAATLYPLFVGMSSPLQARSVARTARDSLLKAGGIVTTPLETGQQWDSPNGWPPLQWIAVDGLRRHREPALAATIACRWMAGVNHLYRETGKLVEKYDVVDTGRRGGGGEYPTQDGFGWTNGVMRRLVALYPAESQLESAAQCPPARARVASVLTTSEHVRRVVN
ncbi:MAG TPA: alpha,alpha-trehalase TreF [Steroidobacteraceae bacterium]|nr:alpha,alpha-trehalase TreF [Steroidobacteraceae bacterium]